MLARWDYSYDNLYRQTSATMAGVAPGGGAIAPSRFDVSYDPAGRLSRFASRLGYRLFFAV